jgi:hypothetical protein
MVFNDIYLLSFLNNFRFAIISNLIPRDIDSIIRLELTHSC